eukprot:7421822-Pyramimonas_sp.AAC.1
MEIAEECQASADSDCEMAGAPAFCDRYEPGDSDDDAIPATEEELQVAPQPQVIRNPTCRATCDDDHLRGDPRDTGDLHERIQCELGHNEGSHSTCVLHDRPSSRKA